MTLARFSLYAVALGVVSVGAVFLIAPTTLTTTVGIPLLGPVARMEIRGIYGGFFIGTGVFFLLCASHQALLRPGLLAQASTMGGLVLGRVLGVVVDGAPSPSSRTGQVRREGVRRTIRSEWIQRTIDSPVREVVQADGRIRRWSVVPEADGKYLRVVLLADGETVHNAFFDRGFKP